MFSSVLAIFPIFSRSLPAPTAIECMLFRFGCKGVGVGADHDNHRQMFRLLMRVLLPSFAHDGQKSKFVRLVQQVFICFSMCLSVLTLKHPPRNLPSKPLKNLPKKLSKIFQKNFQNHSKIPPKNLQQQKAPSTMNYLLRAIRTLPKK